MCSNNVLIHKCKKERIIDKYKFLHFADKVTFYIQREINTTILY